jgi:hypothetical protein
VKFKANKIIYLNHFSIKYQNLLRRMTVSSGNRSRFVPKTIDTQGAVTVDC